MNYEPLNVEGNSRKSMKVKIIYLFLGENPVESGVLVCMKWHENTKIVFLKKTKNIKCNVVEDEVLFKFWDGSNPCLCKVQMKPFAEILFMKCSKIITIINLTNNQNSDVLLKTLIL